MKIILDTNIFISGLISPKSNAGKVLEVWKQSKIEIITSKYLLHEVRRVLKYPKIAKRLNWNKDQLDDFIMLLSAFTTSIDIENIKASVPRDKKDDGILATLIASNAHYLVTGDIDLLSLNAQYPIITLLNLIKILPS